CKQPLVLNSRCCDICQRYFHPSCSLIYLASKQANSCCLKLKLSSLDTSNKQSQEQTTKRTMSLTSSLTNAPAETVSQTVQSSSLEKILNSFIEQQATFNKVMTDSMSQLTTTVNKQTKCQTEMNAKLNDIKKIMKTLGEHDVRINKLEQHNDVLITRLNTLCEENKVLNNTMTKLKSTNVPIQSSASSNIIFTGIPQSHSLNLSTAISKVLRSIEASNQIDDILDIHEGHGELTIKQVFDAELNGKIFINEFLDSHSHDLYKRVKEIAHNKKFKYVWLKQGNIYVRMHDNSDRIHSRTLADLDELQSS
ncbi:hypothetical protein PV326_000089, partial [Microctonus aethiopoides]